LRFFSPQITRIFTDFIKNRPEVLQAFDDVGFDLVEALEDGVLFALVDGDVAAQGIVGSLSHIGSEKAAGAKPRICLGRVEVVFEGAVFGGAGVVIENRRGDQLRVQRLVHLAEQVFVGKMHCRNNFEL
jgi:hypothetical protein